MSYAENSVFLKLAFLSLSIISFAAAPAVNIQSLLADPKIYEVKRITVEGIARVDGDYVTIYPDSIAATKSDFSKGVSIRGRADAPSYQRLNYHWVRVTGVVNTRLHGPYDAFPFELLSERIESLDRPPITDPNTYIIFRNDMASSITVMTSWPGGSATATLKPGGLDAVVARSLDVRVTAASGELIAKTSLKPSRVPKSGVDSKRQWIPYAITSKGLELVPLARAQKWRVETVLPWLK